MRVAVWWRQRRRGSQKSSDSCLSLCYGLHDFGTMPLCPQIKYKYHNLFILTLCVSALAYRIFGFGAVDLCSEDRIGTDRFATSAEMPRSEASVNRDATVSVFEIGDNHVGHERQDLTVDE